MAPCWPKKLKMDTAAGCLAVESNRMKGTKKFPHACMKTKMNTTHRPCLIRGTTMVRKAAMLEAPSIHAASSSSNGTESMKFFIIQMAMGRVVVAMKNMVAIMESSNWSWTNNP